MVGRLKAIEVTKLGPGIHADGDGLYLVVKDSGARSWILRTMVCGKRCEIGLGSLSTRPLKDARADAATLRARARRGEDIMKDRRQKKEAERRESSIPTFRAAAVEYHKTLTTASTPKPNRRKTKSSPSVKITSDVHAYNWLQSLEEYVFPAFGLKPVNEVTNADVLSAMSPIWNSIPETARRTLRRVSAVFEYCEAAGWRTVMIENGTVAIPMANPCASILKALPNNRSGEKHHESLSYKELPEFIQKLRTSQSALSVKLAFEFLILTAARTSEVLEAKWEEFDLEEKVWSIPAQRMKMKEPHKVPLSARCIEILELARQFNDSAIVFPGRYAGHPLSNMAFLMALRRMGYEDLTAHGFRATFKTWSEETTKFDSLVIEASMAHAVKGIERHYLRTTFFDERKKLMNAWAAFTTATPAAKVVYIRT